MFDVKWIRENPDAFDAGLKKRGLEPLSRRVVDLDEARRSHLTKLQDAQNRRNAASKKIGAAKARGDEDEANRLIGEIADLKSFLQDGEEEQRRLDQALSAFLSGIPNLPLDDVPKGVSEADNIEVRRVGKPPEFCFTPRQHFEIGERMGLMDFDLAAKLSGARFVILKGALARLERALAAFMLDLHTGTFGYTEVSPPALVRDDAMFGTGQLPKFADDLFVTNAPLSYDDLNEFFGLLQDDQRYLVQVEQSPTSSGATQTKSELTREGSDLFNTYRAATNRYWLIPTAEVPLTNLVRESILDADALPQRVTAFTPCFRLEAGAAGRDTRGMMRQHQFSKVEMVSVVEPEHSADELERMLGCAEEVLKRLDIAYRVVLLSTGDMGFGARKTYDIEVWLPGQNTYREISSCSLCGDFQARRMQARYRPKEGRGTRYVHTLNGSGLAVGRTLIAVLENYQREDGSVRMPETLRDYMNGMTAIDADGTGV